MVSDSIGKEGKMPYRHLKMIFIIMALLSPSMILLAQEEMEKAREEGRKMGEEFKKGLEEEKGEQRQLWEKKDFSADEERAKAQREWEELRWQIREEFLKEKKAIEEMAAQTRGQLVKAYGSEEKAKKALWGREKKTSLQDVTETPEARVSTDYGADSIKSSGVAVADSPEKVKEAKVQAYKLALKRLSDTILSTKPTNNKSIGEIIEEGKAGMTVTDVDKLVAEKARDEKPRVQETKLPDGKVAVTMQVSIPTHEQGKGLQDVVKKAVDAVEEKPAPKYEVKPEDKPKAAEEVAKKGPFTGLIIDARGLKLKPCLAPEVQTSGGEVVYGRNTPEQQYIEKTGLVGWAKTTKPARASLRVGENPLVVEAKDLKDLSKIVLDPKDASVVKVADAQNGFLTKGRVMVVI